MSDLKTLFKSVEDSYFVNNSREIDSVLYDAIIEYKVDVSEIILRSLADYEDFSAYNITQKELVLYTKNFTVEDAVFILLHELKHIVQNASGKFGTSNDTYPAMVWEGKKFPLAVNAYLFENDPILYNSLPWELDANRFALNSKFFLTPKNFEECFFGGSIDLIHNMDHDPIIANIINTKFDELVTSYIQWYTLKYGT